MRALRVRVHRKDEVRRFDGFLFLMSEDATTNVLANAFHRTETTVGAGVITSSPTVLTLGFQENMIYMDAVALMLVDVAASTRLEELYLRAPCRHYCHPQIPVCFLVYRY